MRVEPTVIGAVFLALASCSETPLATKITDIGGAATGAAFYIYRPGGTLDDYISLEIKRGEARRTVLSISSCSLVAARAGDGVIDATIYRSNFSGKSYPVSTGAATAERSLTTTIRSVDGAPNASDVSQLKRDGFTVIGCDLLG